MAGLAAVDTYPGMLEDKGAALLQVALQAGLFVALGLGDQSWPLAHAPGGGVGAVRIVAISALHDAFVHAVFEGHRELGAYLPVAIPAEIDLLLGQEKLGRSRFMDAVTTRTNHVGLGVFGAPDIGAGNRLRVAFEALIESLTRRFLGKGEDFGLVAAAFNMRLTRPVTALATRNLPFIVGVAEELPIHVGMTSAAGIAAHKSLGVCRNPFGQLTRSGRKENQPQKYDPMKHSNG